MQKAQGQISDAILSYQRALKINPNYAEAHNNLGIAHKSLGRVEEAISAYRQAIKIKPDFAKAFNNLGNALSEMGQQESAVECYRRAIEIKADYSKAYHNLGNTLRDLGNLEASLACQRKALAINPGYAEAQNSLAVLLHENGHFEAAHANYRQALAIKPDYAEAQNNLGVLQKDLGYLEMAIKSHRQALALRPGYLEAHSNLLFTLNYLHNLPRQELLAEAKKYGAFVAQHARPYRVWANSPDPAKKLRVGLVSPDLRSHPVGYFIEGVARALKEQVSGSLELIAYSGSVKDDGLTQRIRESCKDWHTTVKLPDERLAQKIYADQIDILIDLSGHTAQNRLSMFAWKPAPVQVSWLGYFATTGVDAIDYLLADPWALPSSEENNFTEQICRLPETRLCFTPPDNAPEVSELPALKNGFVTFGCFNTLTKMNDRVVALWARILKALPTSRLFLKAKQLNEESSCQAVLKQFSAHGIDASRLILEGWDTRVKYLAAYHRVDISLDTFPFTGGTTSVEGLWMGVPVLTLAGQSLIERQGVGISMNGGLAEWVAQDEDDYVTRAIKHANDLQEMAAFRKHMRRQIVTSPLFDSKRFAIHLADALRVMWVRWYDQQRA